MASANSTSRISTAKLPADIDFDKLDQFADEALQIVQDKCASRFLKESRKYVTRKHRSCHKRELPMSEDEKKEENKRNSRNYTKRNREEIDFYRSKLNDENEKLQQKCVIINELLGPKTKNMTRETLKMSENIMRNIIGDAVMKKEAIDEIFEKYEQDKRNVHLTAYSKPDYTFEKEYNDLKQEYEDLMNNKPTYIKEKGRTNFASAKSRLYQRVLRAELKREYYILHCALENVEQRIENLQCCDEQLKAILWSKFLSPIDEYFNTSTTVDQAAPDYVMWLKIRRFYLENEDFVSARKYVKMEEEEEKEEDVYSAESQIFKTAQKMGSEWTSKRLPWNELIGICGPPRFFDFDTKPRSISPPSSLSPETKPVQIKKEEKPEINENPENVLAYLNQVAHNSSIEISKDTPLRDILVKSRIRKFPPR